MKNDINNNWASNGYGERVIIKDPEQREIEQSSGEICPAFTRNLRRADVVLDAIERIERERYR